MPATRVLRSLLFLTVLVAALFSATAWAKSYDHPLIDVTFRLLPNGDADVEEIRTFRFEGSFSSAYITRSLRGAYGRYGLDYQGVWDADTRQAPPYQVKRGADDVTIEWSYSAQDETKRFLLRYRIRDAVQRYSDVAQFYWKALEDTHAPVAQVRITIVAPAASSTLFKVFIHSQAQPGTLAIAPDFRRAEITQTGIPGTSFLELRTLLDPAIFPQALVQRGQDYAGLLADEQKQASGTLRTYRLILLRQGLVGLFAAVLVGGYIWTYLRYGKEPALMYDAAYEHEPPRPLPPAVVPAIMTQSKVENRELPKGFAATLLEAARFGYLEIAEHEEQHLLGLIKETDLIYRLTEKGKALLAGRAPELKPGERPLEPFEVDVLTAVFRSAGSGDMVTSDQIEAWGKKITEGKSNFLLFVERWGPQLRTWFERKFFKLDDPQSERVRWIFIGVTIAVVALAFFIRFGEVPFVAAALTGAILIFLAYRGLARRTPDAALEVKRWEAFRRFMTDFSAMKDAGPRLLPLWEQYLVYATALGVAHHLLANLKLIAREYHQSVPSPLWYSSPSMGRGVTAMSLESLESMTRSMENFQNLARALSTSSGVGGGFSGGGGGGGGGGGSGAR